MEWFEWVNVTFNNLVILWNGVKGLIDASLVAAVVLLFLAC
jgi:hypothetical protein